MEAVRHRTIVFRNQERLLDFWTCYVITLGAVGGQPASDLIPVKSGRRSTHVPVRLILSGPPAAEVYRLEVREKQKLALLLKLSATPAVSPRARDYERFRWILEGTPVERLVYNASLTQELLSLAWLCRFLIPGKPPSHPVQVNQLQRRIRGVARSVEKQSYFDFVIRGCMERRVGQRSRPRPPTSTRFRAWFPTDLGQVLRDSETEGRWFSAAWLKAHRHKLDLAAADYAELVGVSAQTIYNWEKGRSKPRREQLIALTAIRGIGKREAERRLEG